MLFLLQLLRVSSPFTILACAIKLIKFVIIVYEYQRNKNFFLYLILIMYPVHPHAFPCQKEELGMLERNNKISKYDIILKIFLSYNEMKFFISVLF